MCFLSTRPTLGTCIASNYLVCEVGFQKPYFPKNLLLHLLFTRSFGLSAAPPILHPLPETGMHIMSSNAFDIYKCFCQRCCSSLREAKQSQASALVPMETPRLVKMQNLSFENKVSHSYLANSRNAEHCPHGYCHPGGW